MQSGGAVRHLDPFNPLGGDPISQNSQRKAGLRMGCVFILACCLDHERADALEVGGPGVSDTIKLKAVYERKASPANDPRDSPKLALVLPLLVDLELEFSIKRRHLHVPGLESREGTGDSEIKTKWAISKAENSGRMPGIALETKLMLPTGDSKRGLGSGHTRLNLALLAGRPATPWGYSTKLAYERGFGRDNHELTAGVAGHYRITSRIEAGIEVYTKALAMNPRGGTHFTAAGLKWKPHPRWEVHGVAGRSLDRPTPGREIKTKLTLQYAFD